MSFIDWFLGEYKTIFDDRFEPCEEGYKAGASSRQGEVDELKQALNSALQATKNVCLERDELQNQINRLKFMLEHGLGEDDFKS